MNRRIISWLIVSSLMCAAGYAALFIAPDERTMHDAQRIFYFHVPSWVAMFLAFFVSVFGSISYLFTRKQRYDWLGVAGAEVGVVCCTLGLITGPLWGKPAWGIWWTWDARLTTTFVLWLLYIIISCAAFDGGGNREACQNLRGVRNLCFSRRAAGVRFKPLLAHSAPRASLFRRLKCRGRPHHGQSTVAMFRCHGRGHDRSSSGPLPS